MTREPIVPLVGLNELMVGSPVPTVKLDVLIPDSDPTVTVIGPVVAPVGTVVVIEVVVLAETTAVTPLNFTMLFPATALKLLPVSVTCAPTTPFEGVKEVMTGEVGEVTK